MFAKKIKVKSVSTTKYNYDYYQNLYGIYDYRKKIKLSDFKEIQRHIGSLLDHSKEEFIIDFGCGNGDLTILLAFKYKCKTLGIDYSPDAIRIAKNSNKILKEYHPSLSARIDFICAKNQQLPDLKNVTAVYLCDVIEHMFDEEIEISMQKILSWSKNKLSLVVHTDNNNYLRFVRPITDLLALILGKTSLKTIKIRNNWEKERHVNLTTPTALAQKLKLYGFKMIKLMYSPVNKERIRNQLGSLGEVAIIVNLISFIVPFFPFLLPSFYMVLEKK